MEVEEEILVETLVVAGLAFGPASELFLEV
jgi:hypothetical protein